MRAHWGVQRRSSRRRTSDRFEGDGEDACGGPGEVREDVRVADEVDILSRVHDLPTVCICFPSDGVYLTLKQSSGSSGAVRLCRECRPLHALHLERLVMHRERSLVHGVGQIGTELLATYPL